MRYSKTAALVALAALSAPVTAHSWIEQLRVIDSTGHYSSQTGYPRAMADRKAPGFSDKQLVHILPPSDPLEARNVDFKVSTAGIKPSDAMCRRSQQELKQTPNFPRLSASPGSMIALRYQENGHVTLPQNSIRKPENRGNVYIYGTTNPKPTENFLDVFGKWNEQGTGGDKRGRLLAKQAYDDGQCYQVNGDKISLARQKQFPHKADPAMGMDLWCQNNFRIPQDLSSGKPYTIYWVWDWPTLPGSGPTPKGKCFPEFILPFICLVSLPVSARLNC